MYQTATHCKTDWPMRINNKKWHAHAHAQTHMHAHCNTHTHTLRHNVTLCNGALSPTHDRRIKCIWMNHMCGRMWMSHLYANQSQEKKKERKIYKWFTCIWISHMHVNKAWLTRKCAAEYTFLLQKSPIFPQKSPIYFRGKNPIFLQRSSLYS